MDYHSVHGHDVASFDIPSSHRLPTVTASAALDDELENDASLHIATGLDDLDKALASAAAGYHSGIGGGNDSIPRPAAGGVKRGQVTEVWGPPGTGKTALGLAVPSARVIETLEAVRLARRNGEEEKDDDGKAQDDHDNDSSVHLSRFAQYECLTLAHLIALISRPTSRNIPGDVGLIIIDSATALINSALPRSQNVKPGAGSNRGPDPSVKRKQVLQSIIKSLQTLASTRNCAVVVLSQCATQMLPSGRGATLTPAVNATLWEQGVSTRLVLFRDWVGGGSGSGSGSGSRYAPVFLAGVQKLDGRHTHEGVEHVSAFRIDGDGIASVPYHRVDEDDAALTNASTISVMAATPVPRQQQKKRKLAQTGFEVPDSEDDEDYGWAEEDESSLPPPPPQWQGSEDILLGKEVGQSSDVEDEGDEEEVEEGTNE
ncbi:RecA/RadA recombinase [Geosmithia morbida]|uniref:RecA/RadA recombinase n=1 Tax=Geosmithia morbida TaxID=1094350 RepID=A0A9P5D9M5_9HYPO|nr:RecA/RadA recombinase [Geosmithia morbida]KAF4126679.1 RecA/RadA recombinase [Geosmithia morbida]